MTTIAQLGIRIDSSDAKTAKADLDNLTASATKVEGATAGTTGAFAKAGEAVESFAEHARRSVLTLADAAVSTRAFTDILRFLPGWVRLAAAAATVLSVAFEQGSGRAETFAKAIAQSGDVAGVTAGRLQVLADSVAAASRANSGQASDILAQLTGSGAVQGKDLQSFATAFVEAQQKLGTSSADFVKNLQDLTTQPIQAAQALHVLTPALYDQITAFQKQGDSFGAAGVAQRAYVEKLAKDTQSVQQYTGIFTKSWNAAFQAFKDGWNDLTKLGVQPLPDALLKSLQDKLAQAQKNPTPFPAFNAAVIDNLNQQIAATQKVVDANNKAASSSADNANAQQQFLDGIQVAAEKAQAALQRTDATLQGSIQAIQDAEQGQLAASKAQGDLLDAQHNALLLSDQKYYAAKKDLVEADAAVQTKALNDQIAVIRKAGAAQNAEFAALRDPRNNPALAGSGAPVELARIDSQQQAAQLQQRQQEARLITQLSQIKAQAGAQDRVLDADEQGRLREIAARYQQVVDVAQLYLNTQQQRYQNDELSVGIGQKEQQQLQDLLDIQRQFDDARKHITGQAATGAITKDEEAQDLKAENDAQAASERAFQTHYAKLDELQSNWVNGARAAFQDYEDQAADVANLTDKAFTDAFQSIEDSIVNAVTTGKFSFKDLADSILADLVRVEVKILESQALQAIFGSVGTVGDFGAAGFGTAADSAVTSGFTLGSLPGFASGGQITGPAIVGENGPEIFVPRTPGTILPNDKLGAALGGPVINLKPTYNIGQGVDRAGVIAAVEAGHKRTIAQITNLIRGGAFSQ
ncbi:MAG TPA: phage tail tape measure protein [Steroidobacteraceae bacterium]|nr:phage tail tape measure protein [Steroidobacteraceae bacterium]